MLTSLKVENFRCFDSFELAPLGRINLLVGKNNSGKTSLLEAIKILCDRGNSQSLAMLLIERGEVASREGSDYSESPPIEDKTIEGNSILTSVKVKETKVNIDYFFTKKNDIGNFSIQSTNKSTTKRIQLNRGDSRKHDDAPPFLIYEEKSEYPKHPHTDTQSVIQGRDAKLARIIQPSSLDAKLMAQLFNNIMLNPEEDQLLDALRILDPNIERIAPDLERHHLGLDPRSGFHVKLKNSKERVPIGSMGDGVWRMMGLALALIDSKDSVLLVDEIDTGLHYSAMPAMWQFVWKVAKQLNIQVFATTHSRDCWRSLASIASEENPSEDGMTIHRIERGASRSIDFLEPDIVIAAERNIEVR